MPKICTSGDEFAPARYTLGMGTEWSNGLDGRPVGPDRKSGEKLTFDFFPLERIQSSGRVDKSNGHFTWHALTIAQRRLESPLFCSLDGHRGEASGKVPQDGHVAG